MALIERKLFLDTEFNGFNGSLISMGITTNLDQNFYEVLPLREQPTQWVAEKVLPVLNKKPVEKTVFQANLHSYLQQFPRFTVIADWPEDLAHFNQSLIVGPGEMMSLPSFKMEVVRGLRPKSKLQHNALEDAKALRDVYNLSSRPLF